jgi:hypothetical protein
MNAGIFYGKKREMFSLLSSYCRGNRVLTTCITQHGGGACVLPRDATAAKGGRRWARGMVLTVGFAAGVEFESLPTTTHLKSSRNPELGTGLQLVGI